MPRRESPAWLQRERISLVSTSICASVNIPPALSGESYASRFQERLVR